MFHKYVQVYFETNEFAIYKNKYRSKQHLVNTKFVIHENASEKMVCEIAAILSRGRWVDNRRVSLYNRDIVQLHIPRELMNQQRNGT